MINVADQLDRQDTNGYAGYDRICDMQDTFIASLQTTKGYRQFSAYTRFIFAEYNFRKRKTICEQHS